MVLNTAWYCITFRYANADATVILYLKLIYGKGNISRVSKHANLGPLVGSQTRDPANLMHSSINGYSKAVVG